MNKRLTYGTMLFIALNQFAVNATQDDWGICSQQECTDYCQKLYTAMHNVAPITCDISFLIADLKYADDGQLKICEFGEGNESRFEGHDFMYGKGTIWSNFWNYIKPFGFPIWYVGPKLYEQAQDHDYSDTKEICYPDFLAAHGHHALSLIDVKKDATYKKISYSDLPSTPYLSDAQGLFIFRHRNSSILEFQNIRKSNPRMLIMNSATAPFVNNKYFTNILFDDQALQSSKPRYLLCKKAYNKDLASSIKKAFPCQRYVIKPLAEFKGRGVMIVDEKDLDAVLYKILYVNGVLHHGEKAHKKYESAGHWKRDKSPYFLIEEYCPSKNIIIDGKSYDPTMRVAFVLTFNNNEINIHYLGAYWKIPLFSLNDDVKLTKKHKSWGLSPAKVDDQDLAKVYHYLDCCLPKVYAKMINLINTSHLSRRP